MTDFSNIAYAGLNLSYDRDAFIKEYDSLILPNSSPFIGVNEQWSHMKPLNKYWHVMSQETFEEYDKIISNGGSSVGGVSHQWQMVNMMQARGEAKHLGGAFWRHRNMNNETVVKPEFKDSIIRKWIVENIPHEKIFGIHCVSIDPGSYASIHRDLSWKKDNISNPGLNNGWFKNGFVVINLNISTGGSPLLWALDHERESPRSVYEEEDAFIISDYFLHAVPIVKTMRRQIRVSIVPTPELYDLIKQQTAVILPDDYVYKK